MKIFDFVPPRQFSLLATLLGLLLTFDLDENEQNSFGNFLVSIGQAVLTNVAQLSNQEAQYINKDELSKKVDNLCDELDQIKKMMKHKF